jgi:hypothetical protein
MAVEPCAQLLLALDGAYPVSILKGRVAPQLKRGPRNSVVLLITGPDDDFSPGKSGINKTVNLIFPNWFHHGAFNLAPLCYPP